MTSDPDSRKSRGRNKEPGNAKPKVSLLSYFAIAYAILLLLIVLVVRTCGDIVAPLTFYLYSPRWVILIPAVLILLFGIWRGLTRSAVVLMLLSMVAVVFGLLDYRLGSNTATESDSMITVMTFNAFVASDNADAILGFTSLTSPDIVAMQESNMLDIELPEEYEVYRYGELSVATKHPVTSSPESQYAFLGELTDLMIYRKPLEPTEIASLHRARTGIQSDDHSQLAIPLSLSDTTSRAGQEIELPASRLPEEFTIALKLNCRRSERRQFIFEFGGHRKGFNAYLDGSTLWVGTWHGQARWITIGNIEYDKDVRLYVVQRSTRIEVYLDGAYVKAESAKGKIITEKPSNHEYFCLGSFRGTTRSKDTYRIFPHRCVTLELDVSSKAVVVSCVHNPTPRGAFEDPKNFFTRYRLFKNHAEAVNKEFKNQIASFQETPKIVLGDFNLPSESRLYKTHWGDFSNAFSEAGKGFGHTKRTELLGGSYGTRIDHILYSQHLSCTKSWLGPNLYSDHMPLLAEFRWDGQ